MMHDIAKAVALRVPSIHRLYSWNLELNSRNQELQRQIAALEQKLLAQHILVQQHGSANALLSDKGDRGQPYDIIFVCQDGQKLAPARVRCYRFCEAVEGLGLRSRVLSYVDHLGAPDLGGGSVEFIPEHEKLRLNSEAMRFLLCHPKATFFVQKAGYHFPAVLGAAAVNGNRIVFDYDDYDFFCAGWPRLDRLLPCLRPREAFEIMVRASSLVTVASRELQALLERKGVSSMFIPTVPDLRRFSSSSDLRPLLPESDKVRVWWGGDVWGHVIDNVIRALDSVSAMPKDIRDKTEIVICGFGENYEPLRQIATTRFSHAVDFNFLGPIPPDDMPALMKSIDIGIVPLNAQSVFDIYKSPTKMFELMAMGKAIIADRCGEPARVIDDGMDGFLAEGQEEWAAKLALMIDAPALRAAIGQKARRKVATQYSIQAIQPNLRDVFGLTHTKQSEVFNLAKDLGDLKPPRTSSVLLSAAGRWQIQKWNAPLKSQAKRWMVDNLPVRATDKLRALNRILRI